MKTIVVLITLIFAQIAYAQKTGLGISLGNPTGVNVKRWLDDTHAIDAGFGYSFGEHSNGSIHSDYLFHKDSALYLNDVHPLDMYWGIGGRMEFGDEIELGARVPVGVAHKVENANADMYVEIAPIFDFIGRTGVELHWLGGARYYF